jgi:hypothetical protein
MLAGELTWPPELRAAGGKNLEDGWLIPVAEVLGLLPAGGQPTQRDGRSGVWFQTGLARLYGMAELPLQRLAAGLRAGPLTGTLTWQGLGRELYREEQFHFRLVCGTTWCGSIASGLHRLSVLGGDSRHQAAVELALRSPVTAPVTVQVAWALLPSPAWHAGRGQRRWLWITGRLQQTRWAVALDRSESGVPSFQAELLLGLTSGFAWGFRSEPVTGSHGFITIWRRSSFLLRTSHIAHPDLGLTHRWSLAFGRLGGIW